MPDRSAIGANAYALPDNRYIQQQQTGAPQQDGAVPFFELPKQNDGLAYVEGLTDKYYNTKATIEAYAMDMWKKYGVDVTQPDTSQLGQGGGTPFKSYQKLATQLLLTANDLKTSMEMQKQEAPYRMSGAIQDVEGGTDPGTPINRQQPSDRYFSTKLLPEVEQANEILKTAVYTDADHARFKKQVIDPLVSRYTQQMNWQGISPAEKASLQRNIDALVQMPKNTPYAAFQDNGRKSTVELDVVRKVTNLANGKWAPGSYTTDTDDHGNPVLTNSAMKGEQAGEHVYEDGKGIQKRVPRILNGLVKKTDGVYFTFQQDENVAIPDVKVSSKAGDEITASIIASNPKYGSVTKMYEAMREKGLTDDSGSLINEKVLAGKEFDTPDPSEFGAGITAEKTRVVDELKAKRANPGTWSRKSMSFTLPSGEKITFFPNRIGGGWYIDGDNKDENMTEEEVVSYLAKQKYFNQFLSQKPGGTPAEDAAAVLNPASKKAQDLINKYRPK